MPSWVIEPAGSLDTARRSLCEAGARPAMWMDFGDSIAVGYNAQGRRHLGWIGLAKAAVHDAFGHGGEGFWSVADQPAATPYGPDDLSETGSWTHFQQFSLAGASASLFAIGGAASITWPAVRGNELYLWWSPAAGSSTVYVEVDGVRATAIPLALGGQTPSAPFRQQIVPVNGTGFGDGYHSVKVGYTVAPGVTLLGVEGRCRNGVRWHSMSHFGWATPQVSAPAWSGAAIPANSLGEWSIHRFTEALDLFIYELGGNDAALGIPAATAAAQMAIALGKARAVNPRCSILFVVNHPGNGVSISLPAYDAIVTAQRAVAATFNAAVIDHWERSGKVAINWVTGPPGVGGDGGDAVHPGTSGHAWMAEPAIELLCRCAPCG